MKRPLVIVALLYGGGIVLVNWVPVPLSILLPTGLFLAAGTCVWRRACGVLLAPLLFLTGAANFAFRTEVLSPFDLRSIIGEPAREVRLRGRLVETPYQRVYVRDEEESWRTIAQVEVSALSSSRGFWQPALGQVAVSTPGMLPPIYFAGGKVEITGVLQAPKEPIVEGLFNYRTYLRRVGIYYQLTVASTNDWKLQSVEGPPPLADRFTTWAQSTLALGLPEQDEPLRLLWAMTLGWKTALSGEVSQPFMRSGTMHIFAISGLHIALIAGLLVSVLRVLRVPRGACGVLVIPLIWLYTGVTGWQASAIRSTIMMTVIIAGWSLGRPSDLLNSLAAAALIILVWDPQQLFQASFQLSFFVVLSLALFAPVLNRITRGWGEPDPLLPPKLQPAWQRWWQGAWRWVLAAFCTSLASWLGSIPLVAYYFHLFTPVSLLANLMAVPLSSVALASNLASLVVGPFSPGLAGLCNNSAWLFMWLMVGVSKWAAALPGGCWYIRSPSTLGFIFYYAILVSVMAGWLVKPRLRLWVGTALAILAVAVCARWYGERSTVRLTLLPLYGGNAAYLEAPGRKARALIDCGNESSVRWVVQPFLHAQGLNRLPNLLLTHGDLRHVGGTVLLCQDISVGQVWLSPVPFRSPTYRKLKDNMSRVPGFLRILQRGDRFGPWTVLHPGAGDRFAQADDGAMVLLGNFGHVRILLLSDLGRLGQNALLERQADLRADFLIAGLPSRGEPLADALLEAIQPRVLIITDSEYPAAARAGAALRQRLAQKQIPVLYTRETGAVTLTIRKEGWHLLAMNGARIEGRGQSP